MKLRTLIERLVSIENDMRAGLGADVEPVVVAAIQPQKPLACEIVGVAALDEDDFGRPILAAGEPVVWIVTGGLAAHLDPNAPDAVFEAAE